MATRPMLGDLDLAYVQVLEAGAAETLTGHPVPALEGDLLQPLGRRASRVTVVGVTAGDAAADTVKRLREAFRGATPLAFTADIATATRLEQVLVEAVQTRELAGNPQRYEFVVTLREYRPAPAAERTTPAGRPTAVREASAVDEAVGVEAAEAGAARADAVADGTGTLSVHVDLGGSDDYSGITVRVESSDAGHSTFSQEQTGGIYTFTGLPAGEYRIRAELS